MGLILATLLCAYGHCIRDGNPALHTTPGARLIGGLWCTGAALVVHPGWQGFALGAAVGIGFLTDQMHGEGQEARGWRDAGYLAISGITSLAPLAMVAAWLLSPWHVLVVLFGLAKIPIWFGAWRVHPERLWSKLYPTRVAAVMFGGVVGVALSL